jgi:hypothetical protein
MAMADASEAFLFTRAIDALKVAEECFRGIAIARGDSRWLTPASMMGAVQDNVKKMANQSARQALHLLGQELARKH